MKATSAQRVRPRVTTGGDGGPMSDMSTTEKAERIRGAVRSRTSFVVLVLEKTLQAAWVAAVADLAGDLPCGDAHTLAG